MSNGSFDGLCEKLVKKLDRGVPTEAPDVVLTGHDPSERQAEFRPRRGGPT